MDVWDWFAGLRRWWWMIVTLPIVALIVTWLVVPDPQYESNLTMHVIIGDIDRSGSPLYMDGDLLSRFDQYLGTSVIGDVIYSRLPTDLQQDLSRDEFGNMFNSTRAGHIVKLTVSGRSPDTVRQVTDTFQANITDATNLYAMPLEYGPNAATFTTLTDASDPMINTRPRNEAMVLVAALALIVSIALTTVAEWVRLTRLTAKR